MHHPGWLCGSSYCSQLLAVHHCKKKQKKTEVAATTIIKASARAKRKEGKISKKPKPNLAALLGHSARPVSAQTHPPWTPSLCAVNGITMRQYHLPACKKSLAQKVSVYWPHSICFLVWSLLFFCKALFAGVVQPFLGRQAGLHDHSKGRWTAYMILWGD